MSKMCIGTNILTKDRKNVYCEVESSSPVIQRVHISVDRIRHSFFSNKQLTMRIVADDKLRLWKCFI